MKVYNVNVYDVEQFKQIGKLELVDNIMVTRGLFGAREIVTGQLVDIITDEGISNKVDMRYYGKYGYVLGVRNKSFNSKNVANDRDLWRYAKEFMSSKYLAFIRKNKEVSLNQAIVDYRVKKYLKK